MWFVRKKNKHHRQHKEDAAIRNQEANTHHIYRDMNIQVSLRAFKHHTPNMTKTRIRLITGIIKSI